MIFDEHYVVLLFKSTNVSTTVISMSRLESNLMSLMDDHDHTTYYFEDGFFSAFNQGGIPLVLPPPLMLQPIGPSTLTQYVISLPI